MYRTCLYIATKKATKFKNNFPCYLKGNCVQDPLNINIKGLNFNRRFISSSYNNEICD